MTNRTANLPSAITSQIANAGIKAVQVEAVADHLAALMKDIHGGQWKVRINHESCFVMVVRET